MIHLSACCASRSTLYIATNDAELRAVLRGELVAVGEELDGVEKKKRSISADRDRPIIEIGSCTELPREFGKRGIHTARGNRIDKKYVYRMLNNRAYIGATVHNGESYPGARRDHRSGDLGSGPHYPAKARASAQPAPEPARLRS